MIPKCCLRIIKSNLNFKLYKRCFTLFMPKLCNVETNENVVQDPEIIKKEYDSILSECIDNNSHKCYIIQPYIKWGTGKTFDRTPEQRVREASKLAGWITKWRVLGTECFGVRSARGTLGTGQAQTLAKTIARLNENVTALVVNVPIITSNYADWLTQNISNRNIKVYDRTGIVLRLVKEQVTKGTNAHVQLQLAELDYVSKRYTSNERIDYVLSVRRTQLLNQLESYKEQRELHRKRRKDNDIPIVAIVGYTNAGKSSLVSALVGTEVCSSNERAFHTLEVIGRAGILPCGLRILYMDTVGFLSDIPNILTPLFTATLEDVLLADILIHVVDTSHEEAKQQKEHVEKELKAIYNSQNQTIPPILTVGNKLDLRKSENDLKPNLTPSWDLAVSSKEQTGIDALRLVLEKEVLTATGRKVITLRLTNGSEEVRWLYKNAVVLGQNPDQKNAQMTLINVIITQVTYLSQTVSIATKQV